MSSCILCHLGHGLHDLGSPHMPWIPVCTCRMSPALCQCSKVLGDRPYLDATCTNLCASASPTHSPSRYQRCTCEGPSHVCKQCTLHAHNVQRSTSWCACLALHHADEMLLILGCSCVTPNRSRYATSRLLTRYTAVVALAEQHIDTLQLPHWGTCLSALFNINQRRPAETLRHVH